jgi:hypothetical protein
MLNDDVNPYPTDTIDDEGFEMGFGRGKGESPLEHPCMALKKLLSSGTFYYSSDFDLTRRLQQRYGVPNIQKRSLLIFLIESQMLRQCLSIAWMPVFSGIHI